MARPGGKGRPVLAMALLVGSVLAVHGCSDSSADELEESGMSLAYSDDEFLALVGKYAFDGGDSVDYAAWQASDEDMTSLDEFIELIGKISPASQPELFPSKDRARRYWINAYNALVLDAVLDLWPLDSVREVKLSLTSRLIPGKGFFYDRDVTVGGEITNLVDLEKRVLESTEDPRLHFALNCGSDSCPVLRASDWSEEELDRAAREFINEPENVRIENGKLILSRIFKWYKKEFPRDIAAYLRTYAEPGLARELDGLIGDRYSVRYLDYDWSLNDTER